jgi:hypothetical protein
MGYEKEDGTPVRTGTWDCYAVYEFIVVGVDGVLMYDAHETPEEAKQAARVWFIEEMGGTDEEVRAVDAMTDEQVLDGIIDYDHVAFADVAHRRVLFG